MAVSCSMLKYAATVRVVLLRNILGGSESGCRMRGETVEFGQPHPSLAAARDCNLAVSARPPIAAESAIVAAGSKCRWEEWLTQKHIIFYSCFILHPLEL